MVDSDAMAVAIFTAYRVSLALRQTNILKIDYILNVENTDFNKLKPFNFTINTVWMHKWILSYNYGEIKSIFCIAFVKMNGFYRNVRSTSTKYKMVAHCDYFLVQLLPPENELYSVNRKNWQKVLMKTHFEYTLDLLTIPASWQRALAYRQAAKKSAKKHFYDKCCQFLLFNCSKSFSGCFCLLFCHHHHCLRTPPSPIQSLPRPSPSPRLIFSSSVPFSALHRFPQIYL